MMKYRGYLVYQSGRQIFVHASKYHAKIKGGETFMEFTLDGEVVAQFFGKDLGVVSLEDTYQNKMYLPTGKETPL